MKKILVILLVLFSVFPQSVLAHKADEPPYLQVGGKYTAYYTVYGSTTELLPIPNDIAVDAFVVNTPVEFALTEKNLPIPQEILEKVSFIWDFGDGTQETAGLSTSHIYQKTGSYVASLSVVPPEELQEEPFVLQTTLIHIVPTKEYKLPKAVLAVNGRQIRDPLVDVMKLPLTDPVRLDAGNSSSANKIISYEWDFGDKTYKKTTDPKITYQYDLKKYKYGLPLAFAVVRIRDENGFIADTYAQINNSTTREDTAMEQIREKRPQRFLTGMLLSILILAPVIYFTVIKKKKK